jgi:hypothetical protein
VWRWDPCGFFSLFFLFFPFQCILNV